MEYVTLVSPCANCGIIFGSNPDLVPCIRINGVKEPVCKACVDRANPLRQAKGLAPFYYPPQAYQAAEA